MGGKVHKKTGFWQAKLYFVMSYRISYDYWARGFEPWEVGVPKK